MEEIRFIQVPIVYDITEDIDEAIKNAELCNKEYEPETEDGILNINVNLIEAYNESNKENATTIALVSGNRISTPISIKDFEKLLYGRQGD